MGRIYRRGGTYWGDYLTPEGRRVRRSLRTNDRAVAKERLRQAELAATPAARRRKQRISEAIDYMITATCHDRAEATREMYEQKGRRIVATLGDLFVHEIDRDRLSSYITLRLSDDPVHGGAAPHTVKKELITIRRALREAHERGVLPTMPAIPRFSPSYRPRETWLTPEQFAALCNELSPHRVLWVSLATLAGANASEVEAVDWSGVRWDQNRILIPGTKRETRRRWVPIAPALRARLEVVPDDQRTGRVALRWGSVRRDLHAACDRAGLPRVSPNDLRRTFASWLVQASVPLLTVAHLMGHSSTRMVEKTYGRLRADNYDAAIAMLPLLTTEER